MQIVCPNCTTSYEIAAASLGEAGRMVRCASCAHQWFEMAPDPEPALAGADDARSEHWPDPRPAPDPRFDDPAHHALLPEEEAAPPEPAAASAQWTADPAPDGGDAHFAPAPQDMDFAGDLRAVDAPPTVPDADLDLIAVPAPEPVAEAAADPDAMPDYFEIQRRKKARIKPKPKRGPLFTLPRLTAAMVGVVIGLMYERVNVVRLMPQTAAIYSAVGLNINLRGLTFENVKTVTEMQDGIPVLVIEGAIRNITRDEVDVPRLRYAMRNTAGADIYSWTAVAEKPVLAAGQTMVFRTRLASPPPESRGAYVRFVQRRDLVTASR